VRLEDPACHAGAEPEIVGGHNDAQRYRPSV
jgi:hypothetical protein